MPRIENQEIRDLLEEFTASATLVENVSKSHLEELVMHVSDGCNLACTYCFADAGKYGQISSKWMSTEVARRSVEEICEKYTHVNRIKFFGGEPFLNLPAIEATIECFKEKANEGVIDRLPSFNAISNMTTMTEKTVRFIAENDMQITASLDGPLDINDTFRVYPNGKGSFAKIDDGIRTLKKYASQPTSIEVVFGPQHVVSGYSVVDMYKYMKSEYEIDTVVIHPMVKEPGVENTIGWEAFESSLFDYFFQLGEHLVEEALETSNTIQVQYLLKRLRNKSVIDAHCSLGVQTLTINSEGNIFPCYTFMGDEKFNMGKVGKKDLDSKNFFEVQNLFVRNKRSELPYCSSCDIQKICQACPGAMLHTNESFKAPIRQICDYQSGLYQGFLSKLIAIKNNQSSWNVFLDNISTIKNSQLSDC